MPDSTAVHLLYANQTLEELASIIQESSESAMLAQGAIMEVPLEDVLAVYRDGTARFFSHAGAVLIYEGRDRRCDRLCQQIVAAADQLVSAPKGFALPEGSPSLTVLTLSGEIRAGTDSPLKTLRLGAELIRLFSSLTR